MKEWLETQYDLNDNGCWVWRNGKNPEHGRTRWKGKSRYVHQLYWLLSGRIIPEEMEICHGHKCSKACFNPEHLRADTRQSNILDNHRDGTFTQAKLTREQVLEIRTRVDKSCKEIGKEYGVSAGTISMIVNRKVWSWL